MEFTSQQIRAAKENAKLHNIDQEISDKQAISCLEWHHSGKTTGFKNYQGLPMPEWENLPEGIRQAWIAGSEAICKELNPAQVEVLSNQFLQEL